MEAAKIYGLCLERLNYQIRNAKNRMNGRDWGEMDSIILESYYTGNLEDIADILELYDLEERTIPALREKLDDLAYTVSVLTQEKLSFGFAENGHLGLYLAVKKVQESLDEIGVPSAELAGISL